MALTEEQKANREKWIRALESGEYKQTKGVLHDGVGWCCLGVACDVLGIRHAKADGRYQFDGVTGELPSRAQGMLGLSHELPEVWRVNDDDEEILDSLAELNDTGKSFAEIAELLRQQPEDWTG